jgi:CTP:molybdopterin cytidylyltransferase MocA
LVLRVTDAAISCCPAGVVVVTGAHAEAVRRELAQLPVQFAQNDDWAAGLGGSVRCGVEALPGHVSACLLLLCDQPRIESSDLMRLVSQWAARPGNAAASRYGGTLGVPAIFPRKLWPALRTLRGDEGARRVIAALREVTTVEMPAAAFDVDTPRDLDGST